MIWLRLILLRIVLINIGLINMFFLILIGTGSLPVCSESDVKMQAKRNTCARQNTLD